MSKRASWVDRAAHRIDGWPVGPVAAGLMGAATAFFCFAMPPAVAQRLVEAAGLPLMLPVAAAPDAAFARAAFVTVPALVAAALTYLLFVLIDGGTAPLAEPGADEGDPAEDWLTLPAAAVAPVAITSAAAVTPAAPPPHPAFAAVEAAMIAPAPLSLSAIEDLPEDEDDELILDTVFDQDVFDQDVSEPAVFEPAPVAQPVPPAPAPAADPVPPAAGADSLAAMMARLEDGIVEKAARRHAAAVAVTPPPPATAAPADEDAALHQALADLRRIAAR